MFFYILITTGFVFLRILYKIEAHLTIKNKILQKFNEVKQVKQLVSTTEKNKIIIIWISLKLILNTLYISFLQYMNNSVTKFNNKTYEVSYVINGKLYKMLVVPKRGPLPILQISDESQNDVTDHILPYMGPRYDWYGENLNPKYFGYKSLTFELSDGNEYTFTNDSNMNINKIE